VKASATEFSSEASTWPVHNACQAASGASDSATKEDRQQVLELEAAAENPRLLEDRARDMALERLDEAELGGGCEIGADRLQPGLHFEVEPRGRQSLLEQQHRTVDVRDLAVVAKRRRAHRLPRPRDRHHRVRRAEIDADREFAFDHFSSSTAGSTPVFVAAPRTPTSGDDWRPGQAGAKAIFAGALLFQRRSYPMPPNFCQTECILDVFSPFAPRPAPGSQRTSATRLLHPRRPAADPAGSPTAPCAGVSPCS